MPKTCFSHYHGKWARCRSHWPKQVIWLSSAFVGVLVTIAMDKNFPEFQWLKNTLAILLSLLTYMCQELRTGFLGRSNSGFQVQWLQWYIASGCYSWQSSGLTSVLRFLCVVSAWQSLDFAQLRRCRIVEQLISLFRILVPQFKFRTKKPCGSCIVFYDQPWKSHNFTLTFSFGWVSHKTLPIFKERLSSLLSMKGVIRSDSKAGKVEIQTIFCL